MIKDVIETVKNCFPDRLNENSPYYDRFITHLRYFAQMLSSGTAGADDSTHRTLYAPIFAQYPEQAECTKRVCDMIKEKYSHSVSHNEQCYLLLHIITVSTN